MEFIVWDLYISDRQTPGSWHPYRPGGDFLREKADSSKTDRGRALQKESRFSCYPLKAVGQQPFDSTLENRLCQIY